MNNDYWQSVERMTLIPTILVIGLIIGLILGIVLAIIFLPTRKRPNYAKNPALLFLYEFFNFKTMLLGVILKIFYIASAIALVFVGLYYMFGISFFGGLAILILGNVLIRVLFESIMLLFSVNDSLTSLTRHITGKEDHRIDGEQLLDAMSSKVEKGAEKLKSQQADSQTELILPQSEQSESPSDPHPSFCRKCGSPLAKESKFCGKCGNPL